MGKGKSTSDSVVCTSCLHEFTSPNKLSFLGFRTYLCPQCGKKVYYPLRSDYFGCYTASLVLGAVIIIVVFAEGGVAVPGVLMLAGVAALVSNAKVKKAIAEAERRARANRPPASGPDGTAGVDADHHRP